jgi:iron complex transport system substrate-binding protein
MQNSKPFKYYTGLNFKHKKFVCGSYGMRRIIILFLLLISHFSLLISVAAEPPNRIISLAPNLTEILFEMGLGDKIVGVTNFCDYPDDAKKKAKIGGMYNPSMEAVVSLRPDMVIMTTDGNLKQFEERLRSLGIRTYVFRARRLIELPQGIRDMGSTLGLRERANALASKVDAAFDRFRNENQKSNRPLPPLNSDLSRRVYRGVKAGQDGINKKKVLFIVWPEPLIVAASGTAIDDAISLLGCENIASKAYASYPKYSVEEIIRQAPDVIFIGKGHADVKAASRNIIEKLSGVPAVEHSGVCYINDSIYRLSPRIMKGIDEMARCLR